MCKAAAAAEESSAPHRERLSGSACPWQEGMHTSQSPGTALGREGEAGTATLRAWDRHEPVGWQLTSEPGSVHAGDREQLARRFCLGPAPGLLGSRRGTACVRAGQHLLRLL